MPVTATYDNVLGRVRLAVTGNTAPSVIMQRTTDGVKWYPVRGYASYQSFSASGTIDDYEFPPSVSVTYRLTGSDASTMSVSTTISPTEAWIKVPGAPFLNTVVNLTGWDEITRDTRSGTFEVLGKRNPIVVSEYHSSRSTNITLRAADQATANRVDQLLAAGQVLYLQLPDESRQLKTMYFIPGNYSMVRPAKFSTRVNFKVPIRECAAPNANVVGSAGTWQTVLSSYVTWNTLLAAKTTWQQVAELVGSGSDIIVS